MYSTKGEKVIQVARMLIAGLEELRVGGFLFVELLHGLLPDYVAG